MGKLEEQKQMETAADAFTGNAGKCGKGAQNMRWDGDNCQHRQTEAGEQPLLDGEMREQARQLKDYILAHVTDMLKEPRAFIRHPFIDPGSVYDGNLWDWDSYWSVYALLPLMSGLDPALQEKVLAHAKGNIYNFFDHQLEDGYIPMMIEVGRWPEPYLNLRHKEGVRMNMHKPFLCGQICLISDYIGDYEWVRPYLDGLARYFACYRRGYFHARTGLYIWANDIMIGVDNDPATFGKADNTTANIYLNSFMVMELENMAKILEKLGVRAADCGAETADKMRQVCAGRDGQAGTEAGVIETDGPTGEKAGVAEADGQGDAAGTGAMAAGNALDPAWYRRRRKRWRKLSSGSAGTRGTDIFTRLTWMCAPEATTGSTRGLACSGTAFPSACAAGPGLSRCMRVSRRVRRRKILPHRR